MLHPLTVGDSTELQVGNTVFALGSPLGLEDSFTSGIVSALHRQIEARNGFSINDSIQTDAPINHGNSGGPLLNSSGEVVGVNAQIAGNTGANIGIGFAIPSSTVKKIAAQLIDYRRGRARVPRGLRPGRSRFRRRRSSASWRASRSRRSPKRARKRPPQKAGLHAATGEKTVDGEPYSTGGDVVTAIDGEKITSSEELQRAIDAKQPGDTISITYWRNGDSHTVDVKLATRPESRVR